MLQVQQIITMQKDLYFSLSPKHALSLYCSQQKVEPPRYVEIHSQDEKFRVKVEVAGRSFFAKSTESKNNAEHQAALEAMRFLQHRDTHRPWPFVLKKIEGVFEEANLNLSSLPMVEASIYGHHQWSPEPDLAQVQPEKDQGQKETAHGEQPTQPNEEFPALKRFYDVVFRDNAEEIAQYLPELAKELQFTLEYNTVNQFTMFKAEYICFASLSKDANNMCFVSNSCFSEDSAKYSVNLEIIEFLSFVLTDDVINNPRKTANFIPLEQLCQ